MPGGNQMCLNLDDGIFQRVQGDVSKEQVNAYGLSAIITFKASYLRFTETFGEAHYSEENTLAGICGFKEYQKWWKFQSTSFKDADDNTLLDVYTFIKCLSYSTYFKKKLPGSKLTPYFSGHFNSDKPSSTFYVYTSVYSPRDNEIGTYFYNYVKSLINVHDAEVTWNGDNRCVKLEVEL